MFSKTAADNGTINANTTAEVLGINIYNIINEQVKEIGELILQFFYDCLTKRNIPSEAFIEKKLTEILNDFIQFEKEEIDDFETEEERIALKKKKYKLPETFENAIPVYPDSNYKWEERVDSVGLKPILENIKIKNQKTEKNQNENTMKLRKKFWNDYISQRKRYKTDKEFITQWCEKRGEITVEGEMTITKSTA